MKAVEQTMRETDEKLQKIAPLQSKLEDLRHEANTYRYDVRSFSSIDSKFLLDNCHWLKQISITLSKRLKM